MVGIAAAAVVIFMNGFPYGETMMTTFFDGFCTSFQSLFPLIFSGSLLAQVYNRSGAVNAVGDMIANALFKEDAGATRKYVSCILAMALASGALAFCGLNALVTLMAMYPIALRLMERANVPKRFVMGILSCGVYTFAMSAPGSAETVNILAMQALGTSSYEGIVGGIAACIVEILVTTVLTTVMIKKAVARGERFAYGPRDVVATSDAKCPNAMVSLIPLLVLVVLFNLFKVNIFSATMIAWLLSLVLFWKYLPGRGRKKRAEILKIMQAAGEQAFGPVSAVGSIVGFTTIVQSLPEFQNMLDAVFRLDLSPAVILIAAVCMIAALTSSSTAAIRIAVPIVAERCTEAGLSLAFVHRVSCFACSIVDTLPYGTAVIINLGIADLDMKGGYPPMFVATTLATACGTLVCALVMYFFPYLP